MLSGSNCNLVSLRNIKLCIEGYKISLIALSFEWLNVQAMQNYLAMILELKMMGKSLPKIRLSRLCLLSNIEEVRAIKCKVCN